MTEWRRVPSWFADRRTRVAWLLFAQLSATGTTAYAQFPGLHAVPEMRIDGYQMDLVPITGIAISPGGDIAVVQQQDYSVRVFDARGQPLRTVGGQGSGPGEFRRVTSAGWFGDTLWAVDGALRRLTLFAADRYAGTFTPAMKVDAARSRVKGVPADATPVPLAYGHDRSILATVSAGGGGPAENVTFIHVTPDGAVSAILARLTPGNSAVMYKTGGGYLILHQPFPNEALYAAAPDAARLVIVKAALDGSERGLFTVTGIDSQGDTLFRTQHRFPIVALPRQAVDSAINARIAEFRERGLATAGLERAFRGLPVPPAYPPFTAVRMGVDYSTWIEMRSTDGLVHYLVLDPMGALVGEVSFPERSQVRAATLTRAWTTELDPYDVASIVQYAIKRSP